MEDAYRTYKACRPQEAIEKAKKATAMANALCPRPAACTLTASPREIQKGQSSTLTFSTSGTVKSAMLDGAEAVQNYLVQKGACQRANITSAGYGELKPVADNKTEEGRAENRRVDILILEK